MDYTARKHALKTFDKLVELLPAGERNKPQAILLAGGVTEYRNDTDREQLFRQESNFYYLSGCVIPHSYVLATARSVELFIPKASSEDMMWSVPPPSLTEAFERHDVSRVDHLEGLGSAIKKVLEEQPDVLFHTLPRGSPLFPPLPEEYTELVVSSDGAVTDAYLLSALHRARLIKTEAEIGAIRKANEISSRAHEVVMRVLGMAAKGAKRDGVKLPGEWLIEKECEAEAIFVASCRREGAVHQAYLPIVASSTRAATLHYCCNDREFAWGPVNAADKRGEIEPQVLLIDAGCEWNCYASDITRTMPVGNGGKFTKEAGEIYDLVLEMQKNAIRMIKPGVHWDSVQLECHRTLVRGFQRLGIFRSGSGSWNSEEAILASGVSAAFFPHGVGHSLGLDVHDVPSASRGDDSTNEGLYKYLRLRIRLEEGMVVTVEPGIYFSAHLLSGVSGSRSIEAEVMKRYLGIGGVRIEDVVVVTGEGCENVTVVGKEREWLESVTRQPN